MGWSSDWIFPTAAAPPPSVGSEPPPSWGKPELPPGGYAPPGSWGDTFDRISRGLPLSPEDEASLLGFNSHPAIVGTRAFAEFLGGLIGGITGNTGVTGPGEATAGGPDGPAREPVRKKPPVQTVTRKVGGTSVTAPKQATSLVGGAKAALRAGRRGTLLTGGAKLGQPNTQRKTLLG